MSGNKLVDLLNVYNHDHVILETGVPVVIKPITTGQMKGILQYEGNDDPSVIDDVLDGIINGCVVTEGFDVDSLTLQDRFELLIGIRKVSKGSMYTINTKCPKCKSDVIVGVNLDELEVIPFQQPSENSIRVGGGNLTLVLDHIRRGHQKESTDLVDKMGNLTDNQRRSEIATYMYAFGIKEVRTNQGEIKDISVDDKKGLLDELSASDYDKINDWYTKYNYGSVFKYTIRCGSCGYSKEEGIPLTGFFF